MDFLLSNSDLLTLLQNAEKELLHNEKIKFQRTNEWRKVIPSFSGVYALYEKNEETFSLLYIGETGNLRDRMSDICRTFNHTFRRTLGHKIFNAIKTKSKFDSETEKLLDNFFDEKLYLTFLKVNFGRTEIESYLITKYQTELLNSVSKRKLKLVFD